MIDLEGAISVHEAARRLRRSEEQVRRYLREGKLKGQRIGNQWFVDAASMEQWGLPGPLIPLDLLERMHRRRQLIYERTGRYFDAVELVNEIREEN